MSRFNSDNPTLYVINGKTCSGKTTLEARLVDTGQFERIISHTSRPMRPGEVNGKDYHFVSFDDFQRLVYEDQMIEFAIFNGNYYGSSKSELIKASDNGNAAVIVTEMNGRDSIKEYSAANGINCIHVFVDATQSVISKRIARRVLEEFQATGKTDNAESRLVSMLTTEIAWTPAEFPYDMVIRSNDTSDLIRGTTNIKQHWLELKNDFNLKKNPKIMPGL